MVAAVDPSTLPYRLGVGIMLLDHHDRVFVARRIDQAAEAWQMPQGGIDKGEEPLATALRELEEEIGTNRADLIAESRDWLTYDLPVEVIPKVWKGRYRGQKQKWFAMRFTGEDRDINIATAHPEFDAWRWESPHRLVDLIVPFKRPLYRQIVAEFASLFPTP